MEKTKHLPAKLERLAEETVLGRIEKGITRTGIRDSGVRLGIGDDASVFRGSKGFNQILSCDWFLEGTHFLRDRHPPDAAGWKCLARALSDIAAMGGVPRCFLLSLALPASHTGRWLDGFLQGLRRAAKRFGCVLAGGDTTERADILINVTVIGEVRTGRAVLRSGALPGDILFTSGRLGEAELGLRRIRESKGRASSRGKAPGFSDDGSLRRSFHRSSPPVRRKQSGSAHRGGKVASGSSTRGCGESGRGFFGSSTAWWRRLRAAIHGARQKTEPDSAFLPWNSYHRDWQNYERAQVAAPRKVGARSIASESRMGSFPPEPVTQKLRSRS
jgi:hypothetical protein